MSNKVLIETILNKYQRNTKFIIENFNFTGNFGTKIINQQNNMKYIQKIEKQKEKINLIQ